jgi:hypothetical protein
LRVSAGPISFELEGEWSPGCVILVAPRADPLALRTAKTITRYRANLVVQIEPAEGLALERLAEVHKDRLSSSVRDYQLLSEDPLEVAGAPAVLREHKFVDAAGFHLQQLEMLRLLDDDRALHALASDHVGSFETQRARFREALSNLSIES